MDVPPEIRAAAGRLRSELQLHVEHYGCAADQPETYNHDLKITTEFLLSAGDREWELTQDLTALPY